MSTRLTAQLSRLPIIILMVLIAVTLLALAKTPLSVKADEEVCRVVMVLDRSKSVGVPNLNTMRAQIGKLFELGGLYRDDIELAFWSFSSGSANENYDAPFNGFVSSRGHSTQFDSSLAQIIPDGATNYEQGLGYNQGTMNPFVAPIIDKAQIIVLMSDGLPNTPTSDTDPDSGPDADDSHPYPRQVARVAALKLINQGKIVVGGIIGDANQSSLNYVINGNTVSSSNIFRIEDYNSFKDVLQDQIFKQCKKFLPPDPGTNFNLTPAVTNTSGGSVSTSGSAIFHYNVNNTAPTGRTSISSLVNWSIKQLVVNRGHAVDPLYYGGAPFRDNYSCTKLKQLLSGNAQCTDVTSGQKIFDIGDTSLDNDAPGAINVVLDDRWPVGTKVCYVLTVDRPTRDPAPIDRYSSASCLTIGKRPNVQIHGGDLRVGRHFADDATPIDVANLAKVVTSLTPKADGRTYGSWVEYGVFSPGVVTGFASLSGLEGGYESNLPNTQEFWSKLTFANTDNEYGFFTTNPSGMGTIPNVKSALLANRSVTNNLSATDAIDLNGNDVQSGLYQKDIGNLTINTSKLEAGKSVIVYVPEGTVTIAGNIDYSNGPYTDISQIPQLVIIAKNISIKPSVVHVSAWLIADNKNAGVINTCDDPATLTMLICNQLLRIDGPVMAQHLKLRRTAGGAEGDPAEVINLPASTYLWSQYIGRSDARAQTSLTTELPPYF